MKRKCLFILLILHLTGTFCFAHPIVDQLETIDGGGIVGTLSTEAAGEVVSRFTLKRAARIDYFVWSGLIENLNEEGEDFIIRIYETSYNRPETKPVYEFEITANGQRPDDYEGHRVFFASESFEDLELSRGRYWVSFSHVGYDNEFYISIEKGKVGALRGSGGAGRYTDEFIWFPLSTGVPIPFCRGFSMQVHGQYLM